MKEEQTLKNIAREITLAKQSAKLTVSEIAKATNMNTHTVLAITHGRNANMLNYLKVLELFGAEFVVAIPPPTTRLKGKVKAMIINHKPQPSRRQGNKKNSETTE